ncbi:MAG: efflux RND transporter permease subunit [Melioribacteraceae bacterium]|nr:efflux RND transporter permease subunit [Melioribacteraceae bacterium]
MDLLKIVVERKTFVSMVFIGLSLLGYISYRNLPVELYPNTELPMLFIQVNSIQEVNPSYMENQAIIPLEGAIGTLEGIESIDSYVDSRSGMITIFYEQNINTKYAYLKLNEKIENAKSKLPEGFIVNVLKIDTEKLTNQFIDLEVRGSGGSDRVRNIVEEKILPVLESVDGIANVEVTGGRQKSVEIILRKEISEAYGITPSRISSLINQYNKSTTFVGETYKNNARYFVNVSSETDDITEIENIIVIRQGPVRLKDIADISFGVKEEETLSRVNGKESVTVQLIRDSQVNLIELSHKTQDVITDLNNKLSYLDVEIYIQRNTAEEIERNIDLIIELALVGGLLAIFILWIFLRNFQLVITVALAIPISVFTAFNFFYYFDISINSLTLIGIALAVGMLLDNSVVVLENIYRLSSSDKNYNNTVVQGTKEVWRSIMAATLTTITVFLPFVFSTNFLVSLFGTHIGVSIVSTLIISLLAALFLVPMITHYFLLRKKKNQKVFERLGLDNRLIQIYLVLLKSCIRFPARTIIGAVIIFFASIFIALAVSISVSNEVETDSFNLYATMPEGSTLEFSDELTKEIEGKLENLKEKESVTSRIYEDQSILTIKLKEDYSSIDNKSIEDIKSNIQNSVNSINNAEIGFDQPQSNQRFGGGSGMNMLNRFERMMGIGSQRETVLIKGSDFEKMRNVANDIKYYLEDLSSVNYANVSVAGNRPEIHLLFDTHIMSQFDIPLTSVLSELNTFRKEFTSNTKFKQGVDEYDITIRTEDPGADNDKTMEDLRKLVITANSGSSFELHDISKIIYASGMSSITRVNQEKQIEVSYQFLSEINESNDLLDNAKLEIEELVSSLVIPSGIAIEVVQEDDEFEEYYFLIGVAILLIYMILASIFESLITPLVLMFSIPLAAIGSLGALIITGNSLLNTNTLTGFLILLGVVVNNGIILIDYSRILRKRGYGKLRAIVTAGMARTRPIVITAITTIIAMFPLAMGESEYVAAIGAPFAITVIGGLAVSTLFTLIFIPTFHSGLDNAIKWIRELDLISKILQLIVFIALSAIVYYEVDSFIWQLVDWFLVIITVPAITYFIKTSLRRADEKIIADGEDIIIKIQNLVKVYDADSRFMREWKKGKAKLNKFYDPANYIWEIPFFGFLIYFNYFYLNKGFWIFFLAHIIFFYLLYLIKNVVTKINSENKVIKFISGNLYKVIFWGFPTLNLVIFYLMWKSLTLIVFIAVLWYAALLVYSTSRKLYKGLITIEINPKGLRKVRNNYYKLVKHIPIIGKQKKPFKALNRVTLEIGNGMFGLLGPNGAGKTTLMRIICGILEQSYGKVWINGIDRNEMREELQGLIGYLPQEFGTYENMTAFEFLNYQAILKNILDKDKREAMVKYVLESVHMYEKKDDKIGSFSGGMKQRIGIAQILLHLPKILVVDEPTAGLDPRERIRFRNLLVELAQDRIVIFSTHIIEDISSSCSKVAVLNSGEVKYVGEPAKMAEIAEGKIWQLKVSQSEFEKLQNEYVIINHMRDGDRIRIRCIAGKQPHEDAIAIKPSLEDAYLCLQKSG